MDFLCALPPPRGLAKCCPLVLATTLPPPPHRQVSERANATIHHLVLRVRLGSCSRPEAFSLCVAIHPSIHCLPGLTVTGGGGGGRCVNLYSGFC